MWILCMLWSGAAEPDLTWLEHPKVDDVQTWSSAKSAEAEAWIEASNALDPLIAHHHAWVEQRGQRTLVDALNGRFRIEQKTVPDEANKTLSDIRLWQFHTTTVVYRDEIEIPLAPLPEPVESQWRICSSTLFASGQWVWGRVRPPEDPTQPPKKPPKCQLFITDLHDGSHKRLGAFTSPRVSILAPEASFTLRHKGGSRRIDFRLDGSIIEERRESKNRHRYRTREGVFVTSRIKGKGRRRRSSPETVRVDEKVTRFEFGDSHEVRFVGWRDQTLILQTRPRWSRRRWRRMRKREDDGETIDVPRWHIVQVQPGQESDPSTWTTLHVPERGHRLRRAYLNGSQLLTIESYDGRQHLYEHDLDGKNRRKLVDGAFTALSIMRHHPDALLFYAKTPESQQQFIINHDGILTYLETRSTQLPTVLETIEAPSADGTLIPVSVLKMRDHVPDPDTPVWLRVYGGFNNGTSARIGATENAFLQMGGIIATVHARGGNERGHQWHQAARTKHIGRTFEDVIGAAEWFIERGFTRKGRLVVSGTSNGGLSAMATVSMRPELFGAAISNAGVLDLVRGPKFGNWWWDEYGDPKDDEQGPILRSFSPVHQRPDSVPPILITTGVTDPTVTPSHSFKLKAAWDDLGGGPVHLLVTRFPSHLHHMKERQRKEWTQDETFLDSRVRVASQKLAFLVRALDLDVSTLTQHPEF